MEQKADEKKDTAHIETEKKNVDVSDNKDDKYTVKDDAKKTVTKDKKKIRNVRNATKNIFFSRK